jgi:hypothetical protein
MSTPADLQYLRFCNYDIVFEVIELLGEVIHGLIAEVWMCGRGRWGIRAQACCNAASFCNRNLRALPLD